LFRASNAFLLSCLRWAAAAALSNDGPEGLGRADGLLKLGAGELLWPDEPPLE
jgi:hypothetical protein